MNAQTSGIEAAGGGLAGPRVERKGIKRVRLGSEDRTLPQGVLGLDAISHQSVGSEGIFMAQYTVLPGAHSSPHIHANCETAVYVLGGRAYAYYGEDMGGYVEAGRGDFVYIPAKLAHVVGCPAGVAALEDVVARDGPEEVVITLRSAESLPIGLDAKMLDA